MNESAKRNGEYVPINGGDISRLCGCKLTGKRISYNYGVKFRNDSLIDGVRYPTSLSNFVDPNFSEGYIDYADAEITDGRLIASIENSFRYVDQPGTAAVIEKALGRGKVIFLLSTAFPGRNSFYPLYSLIVKELMRSGVMRADVKVAGPETLRYSVYEDGSVYLLNTDYDTDYTVELRYKDKKEKIALRSRELKHIKLS